MKYSFRSLVRQSQEGSVAVEAAICIAFILAPLLAFIFLFGKFFWHYTIAQKALHDATLYMAKAPLAEVKTGDATKVANFIMRSETAEIDAGTTLAPWAQCGFRVNTASFYMVYGSCDNTSGVPFAVQTNAFLTLPDPFYFGTSGRGTIQFTLTTTMRHAGK